jgi:hypothetical protein
MFFKVGEVAAFRARTAGRSLHELKTYEMLLLRAGVMLDDPAAVSS